MAAPVYGPFHVEALPAHEASAAEHKRHLRAAIASLRAAQQHRVAHDPEAIALEALLYRTLVGNPVPGWDYTSKTIGGVQELLRQQYAFERIHSTPLVDFVPASVIEALRAKGYDLYVLPDEFDRRMNVWAMKVPPVKDA